MSSNATEGEKIYFADYDSPIQKWGYIDKQGNYVIPAIYDDGRDCENGMISVNYKGRWGVIDKRGKEIVPPKYLTISPFREGLALVEDFDKNKFYINQKGEQVIPCPYEECYSFSDGIARFYDGGATGYMDHKGNVIEGIRGTSGQDSKDGFIVIEVGEAYKLIDHKAIPILPDYYQRIVYNEGWAMCLKDGKYGYYDISSSRWVLQGLEYGTALTDGMALIKEGSDYSIYHKSGKRYSVEGTEARYLGEERFASYKNGSWYIYDEEGVLISKKGYRNLFKYRCGVCGMEQGDGWGYIDREGKEIVAPTLPIIWDCSEGYIRFISKAGYGFFDTNTNIKVVPKFLEARDFNEGLARVQAFNKK